jgi:hypothetical protein
MIGVFLGILAAVIVIVVLLDAKKFVESVIVGARDMFVRRRR